MEYIGIVQAASSLSLYFCIFLHFILPYEFCIRVNYVIMYINILRLIWNIPWFLWAMKVSMLIWSVSHIQYQWKGFTHIPLEWFCPRAAACCLINLVLRPYHTTFFVLFMVYIDRIAPVLFLCTVYLSMCIRLRTYCCFLSASYHTKCHCRHTMTNTVICTTVMFSYLLLHGHTQRQF